MFVLYLTLWWLNLSQKLENIAADNFISFKSNSAQDNGRHTIFLV